MTKFTHRWSPKLPEQYGWPADIDTKLWNPAWLTLPREGLYPPGENVFDALQTSLNCVGELHGTQTLLHQRLELPARHFVVVMRASTWVQPPPVFALDPSWRKNWNTRAKLARSDHPFDLNLSIDLDILSMASARKLMTTKGWATTFQEGEN